MKYLVKKITTYVVFNSKIILVLFSEQNLEQDKDSYRDGRNTPKIQLWKSETNRDIKKLFWYHLNIFKSYVNFQN